MQELLIDRTMPDFQFAQFRQMQVMARPETVFDCIRRLDLNHSPLIRAFVAVRALPSILQFKAIRRKRLNLSQLLSDGFVFLGEEPNRELLLGIVGKFWLPSGKIVKVTPQNFADFGEAGYAKAALNFSIAPQKNEWSLLGTETRIQCTDDDARKNFGRYWFVVKPFSDLIRREALRSIKRCAEALDE